MLGSIWVPSKSHQQGQVSFERGMVFLLLITSEFDNRNKTGANTKIFHIFLLALLTLFKSDCTLLLPRSCSLINKFGVFHIWQKTETNLNSIQLYYPVHDFKLGLDRTGHMSLLTGQDWTPKFAGQVLPDWNESGLMFLTS